MSIGKNSTAEEIDEALLRIFEKDLINYKEVRTSQLLAETDGAAKLEKYRAQHAERRALIKAMGEVCSSLAPHHRPADMNLPGIVFGRAVEFHDRSIPHFEMGDPFFAGEKDLTEDYVKGMDFVFYAYGYSTLLEGFWDGFIEAIYPFAVLTDNIPQDFLPRITADFIALRTRRAKLGSRPDEKLKIEDLRSVLFHWAAVRPGIIPPQSKLFEDLEISYHQLLRENRYKPDIDGTMTKAAEERRRIDQEDFMTRVRLMLARAN